MEPSRPRPRHRNFKRKLIPTLDCSRTGNSDIDILRRDKIALTKQELQENYKALKLLIPQTYQEDAARWDEWQVQKAEREENFSNQKNRFIHALSELEAQKLKDNTLAVLQREIDSATVSVSELNATLTTLSTQMKTASDLKLLSEKAQMKAISSVLDTLNAGAKDFLDMMFLQAPISVFLKPFKENKDSSVKAKLSLTITYKGNEIDNVADDLSGGELDRVILAYNLALNNMYNSPILLLDEAFTGLNQELIDICLDCLRQIADKKLVVIVSHGISRGQFDEVVEI